MSNKTKNEKSALTKISSQIGIVLMSVATTFGMVEINNHAKAQILVPAKAVFASENQITQNSNNSSILRDREEIAPHFISYSETQRTPSRSGRH